MISSSDSDRAGGAALGAAGRRPVPLHLPVDFRQLFDEIARFTSMPRDEVEHRVWKQALEPGSNVAEDVARFGVTPHRYDARMEQLYREGDGFIFETMVFWATSTRRKSSNLALERLRRYAERTGRPAHDVDILMLGDGTGNDSLLFASHGFRVHYFEVPGSRIYDFAMGRFAHYGFLGDRIHPIPDYASCLGRTYDALMCFDVLEHLPEPVKAIRDFGTMLPIGGIALITEDFGDLAAFLPTHLAVSAPLAGKTPFMFLDGLMALSWYNREEPFKPMEFERIEGATLAHRVRLWREPQIRGDYLAGYIRSVTRRMEKFPYLGLR
jgi:SAM-dependent methyltransferase